MPTRSSPSRTAGRSRGFALALLAGALLLVLVAPLGLRELGPTAKVRVSDGEDFLDVRVWYVSREGSIWIRCGDRARPWCVKLREQSFASFGTAGFFRGVWVEAVDEPGASARFQAWLEEDYPTLGRLPRLRSLDRALVFRLSGVGRHTPAKPRREALGRREFSWYALVEASARR